MPKKRSAIQNNTELLAVRSLLGAIGALPLETSMRFGKRVGRFLGERFPNGAAQSGNRFSRDAAGGKGKNLARNV
jgi:CelD/BcsL family acetyltransferase involved in cellulose biosynthesis